ncbi:MAG: AsmA-like C-terminal domain-containing protein [Desulfocapsaceae bacterium]|nr:AsmA-like C-terminal domain-containing protein [Desulfocapsaceae bacterium]
MSLTNKSKNSSQRTGKTRKWLLAGGVILLLLFFSALALVENYLASPSLKKQIRETVAVESGAEVDWRKLSLDILPRPALVMTEVTIQRSELGRTVIAELRITPSLLPLLTGDLHLSSLSVHEPEMNLDLPPATKAEKDLQLPDWIELVYIFALIFGDTAEEIADIDVELLGGKLNITRAQQPLFVLHGLDVNLGLSVDSPRAASATLQGRSAEIEIWKNGQKLGVDRFRLDGEVILAESELRLVLEYLELGKPGVALSGTLVQQLDNPEVSLILTGKDIDVEATRQLVLDVAGEQEITSEIFGYLRGGRVEEITFQSQGKVPADLGELENFRIDGKLANGEVSIPPLELDLQDVNGEVSIADGVLTGRNLTARLEGAVGREGALEIGLGSDNDVFNLELLLEADLSLSNKRIVTKIVDNEAFSKEASRISNLQGDCRGRLKIGANLEDLAAEVEVYELNFTADYDRLPVRIETRSGQAMIVENRIQLNNMQGTIGRSQFNNLAANIDYTEGLSLDISSGAITLAMDELYPWLASFAFLAEDLRHFSQIKGMVELAELRFRGEVSKPDKWQIDTKGTFANLLLESPEWSREIELLRGSFNLDPKALSFARLEAASGSSKIIASGTLPDYQEGVSPFSVNIDGKLDDEALIWLWQKLQIPEILMLRAPIKLSGVKVEQGKEERTFVKGDFFLEKGINLYLDLDYQDKHLAIEKLRVEDQHSAAEMGLSYGADTFNLSYDGSLQPKTLMALFKAGEFRRSRLEGKLSLSTKTRVNVKGSAHGYLHGKNISIPISVKEHAEIDEITLIGEGLQVMAVLSSLSWQNYTWAPVQASFKLNGGKPRLKVIEAKLCGIDSPGTITFGDDAVAMEFALEGSELDVASSFSCLSPQRVKMTGTFDLTSSLETTGASGDLLKELRGPIRMDFKDGMIEKGRTLAKILEVLNVTEIFRGKLPDFKSKGFAYSTVSVEGRFNGGKLLIDTFFMDGKTVEIVGQGEINLLENSIDMDLMAAPFKTVDSIIKLIPGVNYLFGGNLIAIPMSVEGGLDDPVVEIMSADSMGSGLQRLLERTAKSPSKLLDLLTPDGSN